MTHNQKKVTTQTGKCPKVGTLPSTGFPIPLLWAQSFRIATLGVGEVSCSQKWSTVSEKRPSSPQRHGQGGEGPSGYGLHREMALPVWAWTPSSPA